MTGGLAGAFSLAPLLPWPVIVLFAVAAGGLTVWGMWRGGGGGWLRMAALVLLSAFLLNPRAISEQRRPQPDVAVIVVDRSASQNVGRRTAQANDALQGLRESLGAFEDLEVKVVETGGMGGAESGSRGEGGTRLMTALRRALAEVPRQRFAGTVLITDGQVHDVPKGKESGWLASPVHVLLTGKTGETDRRLVVEQAPGYGIVGGETTIRYRVEDRRSGEAGNGSAEKVRVTLRRDGTVISTALVAVGRSDSVSVELDHAGPTVIELEAETAAGELSLLNNRAVVTVNGVRDRLRVLLLSGQPHPGERTWRNLLKSDPSVDLVHFTILRPPEKTDFTPLNELALIVFPIDELFQVRLGEFDLVVFDRFILRHMLAPSHLRNIVAYLEQGGALLLAVGPEFAGPRSMFNSLIGPVMPGVPTGRILEGGFKPRVTDLGRRHPVTSGLLGRGTASGEDPTWGRWFRQVEAVSRTGSVLMDGLDGQPLLILGRVGKGRIAQLMSDQIWLWARGFEGGGPQGELLRRLAHWLMKEPDLEENSLRAEIENGRLTIRHQSLEPSAPVVKITDPSGNVRSVALEAGTGGGARAVVPAEAPGLYRIDDGSRTVLAAGGAVNPLELADLRATAERLSPVAKTSGGGVIWIGDGIPQVRRTKPGRDTAGKGWIGLRQNRAYVVAGATDIPLLPGWAVLVLVLSALGLAWWKEGR